MRNRRLIVTTPEGERELLFVGRLVAGRAPECDISLADTKVSRRHAEFDASGPAPRVRDLDSRNGILVNGRKVDAAELAPGDVVTIGDARVRVEERSAAAPARDPMASTDDRTAVLPPAGLVPPVAPGVPGRTGGAAPAVPTAAPSAAAPAPAAAAVPASEEPTAVLPQPTDPDRPAPSPSDGSAPPSPTGFGAPGSRPSLSTSPDVLGRDAPPARPKMDPGAMRVSDDSAGRPFLAPLPATSAAGAASSDGSASRPYLAPVPASALRGPRISWAGFLLIACILLGSVGVLLGALPLLSASSTSIDALGRRQARTLGGWLASAVRPDGGADAAVVDAVLSQPGVQQAMLLDILTGRVVAPAQAMGRPITELPVVGTQWRSLRTAIVEPVGASFEALVPAGTAGAPHVAWVRYERRGAGERGLAVLVALGCTLVLGVLASLLIRRHTGAVLQHFTRQVELAVSGAPAKVMQGTLMPGLDRLPGVVTYLLERRTATGHAGSADRQAAAHRAAGSAVAAASDRPADPVPAPAPWLEITPALTVAGGGGAMAPGEPDGATVRGRHLLDVLTDGALRNAAVQGLGALGSTVGAEAVVSTPAHGTLRLTRLDGGSVRVTLAVR